MMIRLKILILLAVVLLRLVILVVGRIRFTRQHVAAVLFVAHGADDALCRPMRVQRAVPAPAARRDRQFGQYVRDFFRRAAAQQHRIHPAHDARFVLVDLQHLLMTAVSIRHFDLVVAEQTRRQKPAPAEPPLERQQDCLALHMAFFLRDHRQHEQDDAARLRHGIKMLRLKKYADRRIVILQRFDPADAVHQIPCES